VNNNYLIGGKMNSVEALPVYTPKKKKLTKDRIILLCLATPFIIYVLSFFYVPLFGWIAAFFNYSPGMPLDKIPFVGFQYFRWMLTTERNEVVRVVINTIGMNVLYLLTTPLPVILAILLNEVRFRKFKRIVQSITTLPHFISWVIVFSLAFSIFSSEGFLNTILQGLGLIDRNLSVLDNKGIVWTFQTALVVWKSLGWNTIIYMAAISGIDAELYDAASVDGAGRFAKAIHITLPGLMPTYFVLLLLGIGWLFSSDITQILMFHNGLVAPRIETIDYYAFRVGVVAFNYSYGTAIGILRSIISIVLLFSVNQVSKKIRGESIF